MWELSHISDLIRVLVCMCVCSLTALGAALGVLSGLAPGNPHRLLKLRGIWAVVATLCASPCVDVVARVTEFAARVAAVVYRSHDMLAAVVNAHAVLALAKVLGAGMGAVVDDSDTTAAPAAVPPVPTTAEYEDELAKARKPAAKSPVPGLRLALKTLSSTLLDGDDAVLMSPVVVRGDNASATVAMVPATGRDKRPHATVRSGKPESESPSAQHSPSPRSRPCTSPPRSSPATCSRGPSRGP